MTTTSTPKARSGPGMRTRRVGAAVTALAIAAPLAGVALTAPAAVAAENECTINAVIEQDITQSFSAANFDNTKAQISNVFDTFEGTGIPTTIGLSSFGSMAPLATAPSLIGVDANSAAGAQALRDQVASYNYMTTPTGQIDQKGEAASGSNATNWQAGLQDALANAQAQGANKIVFITDGVANAYTNSSGQYIKDSIDNTIKAQAAAAAGDVADQIRAAGIELQISFVRTNAVGGGGLDDTMFPADPNLVVQSMQELQPGFTIGDVVSVEQIAERILSSTLTDCSPAISLTKSHTESDITDVNGDGFTNAGDQVVFTFVATNTGNMALTNAVVTDPKLAAAGVSLVGDGKLGALAVGASGTVKSNPYTLTQADVDAGKFDNVATVKANSPKGPVTDEDDDRVPTNDAEPGISLVKSHKPESIVDANKNGVTDAGDTVEFDFVAKNTGNVTIENAIVTDPTLEAAGIGLVNGGKLGSIAVGASASVKSEPYVITQADTDAGQFLNVATVTGDTPKGPVDDDDDDKVPTNGTPGIKLEKSHDAEDITDVNGNGFTDAGDTVVFDLKATNTGHLTIENAVITDEMLADAGVKLEGEGKLGTIAVGQSATIKSAPYTVTQKDVDNGGFTNVALVTGDTPKGPVKDDDDDKVPTDQKPSIDLVKSHVPEEIVDVNENGIVDAGDQVVFDFDATNTGTVTITDAVVTDEILAGFDVALVDGGKLGTIKVGETVSTKSEPYTITQADVDAGQFHNVAVVDGDTPKGPVTDEDDDEVPTDGTPGISIEKSHKPEAVIDANKNGVTDAGDTVVFGFDVTNTGNVTITEAIVTDEKLAAAGVELVDGGNVGALEIGASASMQSLPYTITLADVDAGKFVNVGKVTGETPRGPVEDNDDDEVPTQPAPAPPASEGSSLATTGDEQAGRFTAIGASILALLGGGGLVLALRNRRGKSVATSAESQD